MLQYQYYVIKDIRPVLQNLKGNLTSNSIPHPCHLVLQSSIIPLYLHFNGQFSRWTWVSWYPNVSILDFIEAKDDGGGGDNRSCKICKALVKLLPPTNPTPLFTGQTPFLLPINQPTVSKLSPYFFYMCRNPITTWLCTFSTVRERTTTKAITK